MERTEVFRRVVAEKVKHYLCEALTDSACLTGDAYRRRIEQVKLLLTPTEWDEVAINRASMGHCGWLQCAAPATRRKLGFLAVMLQSTLDRDVIDSFHSIDCLNAFKVVRAQLDPTISQLRAVPPALSREFLDKRLPTSNLKILAKQAGLDDNALVKEISALSLKPHRRQISAGSLTAEESPNSGVAPEPPKLQSTPPRCQPAAFVPKKSNLATKEKKNPPQRKKVSFSDVKLSHEPRRRDVASADDWKSMSRRQALMLSFMSGAQVDHIKYEDDHKLDYFASLEELYDLPYDKDGNLLLDSSDEDRFVPYDDN